MAAKKRAPAAMKAAGAPAPPLPKPLRPLLPGDMTHLETHEAIRQALMVHSAVLEEMNERLALLEERERQ